MYPAPPAAPHDSAAALLDALVRSSTLLLGSDDFDAAVTEALGMVARAAGMQRASLVRHVDAAGRPGRERWEVAYEWHDPAVPRQGASAHATGSIAESASWSGRLFAGEPVLDARTAEIADPGLRAAQEALGARYLVSANIFVDGASWGALSLDDCRTDRRRGEGEKAAIAAAAQAFGLAVHRHHARAEAARLERDLLDQRRTAAEARAAELARANQVLRNVNARLAGETRLDAILGHVLAEACAVLGTPDGCIDLLDETGTLRLVTAFFDGHPSPTLPGHPFGAGEPIPLDEFPAWPELVASRGVPLLAGLPADAGMVSASVAWHVGRGHTGILLQALMLGDEPVGMLGLAYRGGRRFSGEQLEFLQALGQQAALAVQATRLAAATQEAAVAREREAAAEERAALLARSHDAMRRSVDRLASQGHIDALLEGILLEAMRVAGAAGGGITLWEGGRFRAHACVAQDGAIVPREVWEREAMFVETAAVLDGDQGAFASQLKGQPFTLTRVDEADAWWPAAAAYHRPRGHVEVWNVPCVRGGELLAHLGLAFREPRGEDPTLLATLASLAQQVTLALELTRLADQARDAAVARERRAAAERRAAEFGETAAVLARSMQRLAASATPDGFVEQLHRELCDLLGGEATAQFRVDWEARRISGGVIVDRGGLPVDRAALHLTLDEIPAWRDGLHEDTLIRLSRERDAERINHYTLDWMRERGFTWLVNLPLFVDGRPAWVAAVTGRDEARLTERNLELFRLLSRQLTLALELRQLAEEAHEAALAREREAAAERRAAEFEETTALLARSMQRLAASATPDGFVEQLHRELCDLLGGEVTAQFRLDAELRRISGAVIVPSHGPRADISEIFVPIDEVPAWRDGLREDRVLVLGAGRREELIHPATLAFMRERGLTWLVNLPLFVDGVPVWVVAVLGRDEARLTGRNLELFRLLSRQLTLALELRQLAEEAREGAVAREREAAAEERAAQLTRASNALARTAHRLAAEPDLDAFLRQTLLEIALQLRSTTAVVTPYDPAAETLRVAALVVDGGEIPIDPIAPVVPRAEARFLTRIMASEAYGLFDTEQDQELFWPGAAEFLRARGMRKVLCIPIRLGDLFLGQVSVAYDELPEFSPEQTTLVRALSNQAALAIQLTRLAQAARDAAVAREREEAAHGRAAELARANEALREREVLLAAAAQASRVLLESDDLGAAMPVALEELGRAAGWSRTQILLSATDEAGRPGHRVHAEWVDEGVQGQLGHATHEFIADEDVRPLAAQVRQGEAFWVVAGEMEPGVRAVFEPLGIVTTVAVPVFVEGGYVGVVGFDDCVRERPRTDHEMDALRTASRVIAAAFQRDRLVDAVGRERERAARERAAELGRANEALQRTVGRLSDVAEVRDFYVVALAEMASALAADSAGLMLYDAARGTFRMACSIMGGAEQALAGGPHDREWTLDDPVIARSWEEIQRADPLLVVDIEGPYVHPDTREWHRARGDEAALYLPLFRGQKPLGFVAFGVRAAEQANRVGGELASALGQQLALALELERLAREARTAAVARERRQAAEERAAELARANAVLRTSLDALAAAPDAQIFLAQVLQVAAEQFSAAAAVLWAHEPGRVVAPLLVWADGRGYTAAEFAALHPECPSFRPFAVPPAEVDGEDVLARRRHFLIRDIAAHPAFRDAAGEAGLRWYRERGARQELNVPLRLGDDTVGSLAVYLPAGPPPTAEQVELAYALAAQATLALELTRLGDVARDAAVVRERERAAEERAAELARANEALRSGLDRLAGERDTAAFLRHILAAAAEALDARGAAFFRFHPRTNRLAVDLAVNPALPGVISPQGAEPFAADADATPYWRILVEGRRPRVLDAANPADEHLFWPGTRQWHLDHGQPVSVGVPLVLGDEPLGFVGFTLGAGAAVTAEQLGLVQALAHQAALALHLTRLSEETRDAAVARERERAAEERAAELARANEALRRSVASVATLRDIDAFLVEVLRNATDVAGAVAGAVVLGTADDTSLRMHSFVRGGRSLDPGTDPLLAPWRNARPLREPVAALLRRLLGEGIGWADADHPSITGEIREWHRGLGHARVAHIPLFRGDEPIGFIALCFAADAHPPPERLEMVRVLAQQAALALELSRLGGEAEQAAVAEERNRIAREIHDTLARGFSGIIWTLEGVKQGAAAGPGEVAARVDTALELARDSLAQARQSLWALRPGTLPRADLERELRRLAAGADGGDTRVELAAADPVGPLASEAQVNLLRIAEEAVNNALRHAAARSVLIELVREEGFVTLRVTDDGKGFGAEAFAPGESFGLRGMRERAQRAGGQLEIDSEAGRGTVVTARVPAGTE